MKQRICAALGALGGALSAAFGGWDAAMTALVALMGADYVTGVLVAGVFHRSDKTGSGTLSSRAGFYGLCRKGVMLLLVLVGARLDAFLGVTFLRDAVAVAFLANELLSVMENAALMGVPVPEPLRQALDLLRHPEHAAPDTESSPESPAASPQSVETSLEATSDVQQPPEDSAPADSTKPTEGFPQSAEAAPQGAEGSPAAGAAAGNEKTAENR